MKLSMANVKVMLAMPTHRDIPAGTVRSLLETQHVLASSNIASDIEMQVGGSIVHHARTKAAWNFLKSDCTHLFWVDSDMAWLAKDFIRLLAIGTKLECVFATYPCRAEPIRFFVSFDEKQAMHSNEFGCLPVNGAGLGFCCVQREVVQKIADQSPKLRYPDIDDGPVPRIFRCDDRDGYARGEDIAFFDDIRMLGYQTWLDPSIELGHIGSKEYRAKFSDHLISET
jgi:hypothetical protein